MPIILKPFGSDSPEKGYIGWTPTPLIVANPTDEATGPFRVTSRSKPGFVSKAVFLSQRGDPPQSEIEIDLKPREEREIFVAGAFQPNARHFGASVEGKDVSIEAVRLDAPSSVIGSVDVMIRARRNANTLSGVARDDFLFALGKLNGIKLDDDPTAGPGRGPYVTDFVATHVDGANASEHGDSHFLPWHRLYLLDLERQLQAIRPTVTLPYWRFDQPAPNLFNEDFMGAMDRIPRDVSQPGGAFDPGGNNTKLAGFANDNPLARWQIRDAQGIPRAARFDPRSEAANGVINTQTGRGIDVIDQLATLRLGEGTPDPANALLGSPSWRPSRGFARMEETPHGAAHVSFNGRINQVPVAPHDPLFFLLHANIDRLWILWQSIFARDEPLDTLSYPYQTAGSANAWEVVGAEQWPWNDGLSEPGGLRPPGTRRQNFTASDVGTPAPGRSPTIRDTIDAYGHRQPDDYLGFCYDDVPFNHAQPATS